MNKQVNTHNTGENIDHKRLTIYLLIFKQSHCSVDKSLGLLDSKLMAFVLQSRDVSSLLDDWDDRRCTNEEIETMVQSKKEAALKREKALAYASSQVGILTPYVFDLYFKKLYDMYFLII